MIDEIYTSSDANMRQAAQLQSRKFAMMVRCVWEWEASWRSVEERDEVEDSIRWFLWVDRSVVVATRLSHHSSYLHSAISLFRFSGYVNIDVRWEIELHEINNNAGRE